MARIRVPDTAKALLVFCTPWPDRREDHVFPTYAKLLSFAACYGFKKNKSPDNHKKFLKKPDLIDYEIFKKEGIHVEMLTLTIQRLGNVESAQNEAEVVRAIEDYSAVGFKALKALFDEGANSFVDQLGREITKSSKG